MNRRPLRVLHVTHGAFASDFFVDLARLAPTVGHEPTFALLGPARAPEELESHGARIVRLGGATRREYPQAAVRLARYLRAQPVDIVHTHLFDPSLLGMAVAASTTRSRRVLGRHHSDLHFHLRRPAHVVADRVTSALAHRIIANSEWTARVLVEREHVPARKVTMVRYGIDLERRPVPTDDERSRLRDELGVGAAAVVAMVGRLHPVKGHEHLLRALPGLRERLDRELVVLIAGSGGDEARLRVLATELGVDDAVRFLGFRTDAHDLFALSDVTAVPSLEEAFGQVVIESMAAGTPVVAARTGGMPEIITERTGVLVPPADSASLEHALAELLADNERRRAMARAARARVEQHFDVRQMMQAYDDTYRGLLSPRSGSDE